jgi:hypothetical protein
MWPCNFFQRGGASNTTHAFSRLPPPPPPPPPASPPLLGTLPHPPHPPSSIVVERDISDSGAPTGVFSPKKGDPSNVTGKVGIFDGSEPWENSVGAQEVGDDQQRPLPPPPAPLVSLVRDLETNGDEGGGGGKAWPTRGPS